MCVFLKTHNPATISMATLDSANLQSGASSVGSSSSYSLKESHKEISSEKLNQIVYFMGMMDLLMVSSSMVMVRIPCC